MKNIKKIICLLLASIMIFAVGCKTPDSPSSEQPGDNNGGGSNVDSPVNPVKPNSFGEVKGEKHDYKITETGKYIINAGRTDYKILIPKGMAENEYIASAVSDLKLMFSEAADVELEVVEDDGQLTGKYLAVHSTSLCSAESIGATSEKLGRGGFRIVTKGDNVIMCGATPESSMYAAYEFLHQALGFDLLYTDYYVLDKNVTDLKLMNYDVTDIPDFEYRIQSTGWIRYNDQNVKRMKWTNEEWIIPADESAGNWHNTFIYLPPATYKVSRPEWYSEPRGDQLCYTAHGNEDLRAEMIEIVSARIIELFSMEKYKNYNHISVSIEDNQNCCICETCSAAKQKYGADSAVIILFLNEVASIVEEWMNTDAGAQYKRDFRILFFAYHATNAAPVVYDETTKEYKPSAPEVVCHPNVAVYFAETNGDYTQNFHDEGTANTQVGKNMKGWGALSNEIYFWSYSTNFSYFLTPYNSFDTVQDILKFAKNEDTMFIMIQDQWIQPGGQTGFGVYKNWLHSKLEWDVNANVSELEDYFFDNYFLEASDTMHQLFNEYRAWARYQTDSLGYKGFRSVYYGAIKEALWPQRMLERWISLTDKARKEIEIYKQSNPELYRKLDKHIAMESIAFRYLLVSLYSSKYEPTYLNSVKQTFANDAMNAGLTLVSSMNSQTIEKLLSQWGVM
ncbi:MAG: DUF4838 domain-containing protein [Clostridia bacterium]|nr:DUF4838 domain-containing protein [Clostridia bacterium]